MLHIGCHLSSTGGYLAMGKEALRIGADTFAFFTRNPRGGNVKPMNVEDAEALRDLLKEHHFAPLVAHAPYTYNLCSDKEVNRETTILLETMAGKGTEVGRTFGELRQIIDAVRFPEHMGVCLDTCHVFDGGYDIQNRLDEVVDTFDREVGLGYLKAIHLNDSKNPFASHKDRHEVIGEGSLGLETFRAVVNHPKLKELPFILETPQPDNDGYMREIAMVRGLVRES